jgi:hypothetical protein
LSSFVVFLAVCFCERDFCVMLELLKNDSNKLKNLKSFIDKLFCDLSRFVQIFVGTGEKVGFATQEREKHVDKATYASIGVLKTYSKKIE